MNALLEPDRPDTRAVKLAGTKEDGSDLLAAVLTRSG